MPNQFGLMPTVCGVKGSLRLGESAIGLPQCAGIRQPTLVEMVKNLAAGTKITHPTLHWHTYCYCGMLVMVALIWHLANQSKNAVQQPTRQLVVCLEASG